MVGLNISQVKIAGVWLITGLQGHTDTNVINLSSEVSLWALLGSK